MKKFVLLGILVAAMLVPAAGLAGSASTPKPESMIKQLLTYDSLGQYGRAWDLLHPGQQKLVSRDKFVGCQQANSPSFDLVSFKVLDKYRDPIHAAGVPQHTSVAVTVRVSFRMNGKTKTVNDTMHAVWTGTRWAAVLAPEDIATYKAGDCP